MYLACTFGLKASLKGKEEHEVKHAILVHITFLVIFVKPKQLNFIPAKCIFPNYRLFDNKWVILSVINE